MLWRLAQTVTSHLRKATLVPEWTSSSASVVRWMSAMMSLLFLVAASWAKARDMPDAET